MRTLREKIALIEQNRKESAERKRQARQQKQEALDLGFAKTEVSLKRFSATEKDITKLVELLKDFGEVGCSKRFSAPKLAPLVLLVANFQPELLITLFEALPADPELPKDTNAEIVKVIKDGRAPTSLCVRLSGFFDEAAFNVLLLYVEKKLSKEDLVCCINSLFLLNIENFQQLISWLNKGVIEEDIFKLILCNNAGYFESELQTEAFEAATKGEINEDYIIFLLDECKYRYIPSKSRPFTADAITKAFIASTITDKVILFMFNNQHLFSDEYLDQYVKKIIESIVKNKKETTVLDWLIINRIKVNAEVIETLAIGNGKDADNSTWHDYLDKFLDIGLSHETDDRGVVWSVVKGHLPDDYLAKIDGKLLAQCIKYRTTLALIIECVKVGVIDKKYIKTIADNTDKFSSDEESILLKEFDDEIIDGYFKRIYPEL